MPTEVSWRLDHGKWIMRLNLTDVLSSADSEMGFVSKITEGWTCEGQLTALLLNLGLWFCSASPPCLCLSWHLSHPTVGQPRELNWQEVSQSMCRVSSVQVKFAVESVKNWIMHQIKLKLVRRLRAGHGTSGPQSALTITAPGPVSWRLFLSCSGSVVALQKSSSSLCLAWPVLGSRNLLPSAWEVWDIYFQLVSATDNWKKVRGKQNSIKWVFDVNAMQKYCLLQMFK